MTGKGQSLLASDTRQPMPSGTGVDDAIHQRIRQEKKAGH